MNHHREIAYWRQLLERVATDLESAAAREADPKRRDWLAARAMRIRQRLHEGVPDSFTGVAAQRMNPRT